MTNSSNEKQIFNYFINYEEENIYNQLKFDSKIKLEPINKINYDFDSIRREFINYKEKKIKRKINEKISKNKNNAKKEIFKILDLSDTDFKVEKFIERLKEYNFFYKEDVIKEIEKLLRSNEIYIFSPFFIIRLLLF